MPPAATPLRLVHDFPITAPAVPHAPGPWAVPGVAGLPSLRPAAPAFDLAADLYNDVSAATADRYAAALRGFAAWLGIPAEEVPTVLLAHGRGPAVQLSRRYKQALMARGRAPATVNVALAALRNVVNVARQVGLVEWALEVRALRVVAYRDTRGPGVDAVRRMLATAAGDPDPRRAAGSVAVLRVLVDLGLRRAEAAGLTIADLEWTPDVDPSVPTALWVLGKGHRERQRLDLPPETATALAAWLTVRGQAPGSVFGLRPRGLARRIAVLGTRSGVGHVRVQGLRHVSVSLAVQATHGDCARARTHSRHAHIQTLTVYRDAAQGEALSVARLVAAQLDG